MNAVFDQAQFQINRDRAALPPSAAVTALPLPLLLRHALSCLLLAVADAAFAHRPGSNLSLLQETQKRLQRLQPLRPRRAGSQGDDIRQLSGREE
ncbi:MAG: hypothetical protein VKK97_03765 [Synechococcaceae cyanobacterium]|nr:hypothetical protein [Synechococcaceae cyanobacterium]